MDAIKLIEGIRHQDERGFFSEVYNRKRLSALGIDIEFVQDNYSQSHKTGTLRGLHFQLPPFAQAKLVRCGRGAILDVVVDIRKGSPSYGQWKSFELTAENGSQLFVPVGFAHGFLTLEPDTEVTYKCSNYYVPASEGVLSWSDPDVGIKWPFRRVLVLNGRDKKAPHLKELENTFIFGVNS